MRVHRVLAATEAGECTADLVNDKADCVVAVAVNGRAEEEPGDEDDGDGDEEADPVRVQEAGHEIPGDDADEADEQRVRGLRLYVVHEVAPAATLAKGWHARAQPLAAQVRRHAVQWTACCARGGRSNGTKHGRKRQALCGVRRT